MSGLVDLAYIPTYQLQEKFSFSKNVRYKGGKGKLSGLKINERDEYGTTLIVIHERRPDDDEGRKFDYRICLKQGGLKDLFSDGENEMLSCNFLMSEIQRFSCSVKPKKRMRVVLNDKKSTMEVSFPTRQDMLIVRKFLETNHDVKREEILEDPLPGPFICEKIFPKNFSIPTPQCEMWTTEEFVSWLQIIPFKTDSVVRNRKVKYFYMSLFDHLEGNEKGVIEFIRTLEHPFEAMKMLCRENTARMSKEACFAMGRHFDYLENFFKGMFDIRFYTILWKRPENRNIVDIEISLLTHLSSMWNLSDLSELILFSWLTGVDYKTWIDQKRRGFKEFCESEQTSHMAGFAEKLYHYNRLHKIDLQIYDLGVFQLFMETIDVVPWNDVREEIKVMEKELEYYTRFFEEHDALEEDKLKLEEEKKPTDEVVKSLEEHYYPYRSENNRKKSILKSNMSKKKIVIITKVKNMFLLLLEPRRKEAMRRMNREATQKLKEKGGMNLKVKLVMSRFLGQPVGPVQRQGVRFLNTALSMNALRFGFLHAYVTVVNVGIHWFDRALCFIGGGGKEAPLSKIMQEKYETICCLDVTCPRAHDDVSIVRTADKVARFLLDCNLNKFYSNIGVSRRDQQFNCQEFSIKLLEELDAVYPVHKVEMDFIKKIRNLRAVEKEEDVEYFKVFECPSKFPKNLKRLFPASTKLKKKKIIFRSHQQLDRFVRACMKEKTNFRTSFPGEYELLKGFDRAFWMALQYGKQGPEIAPLRGRNDEILCPFSRKKDWDEEEDYKIDEK